MKVTVSLIVALGALVFLGGMVVVDHILGDTVILGH